MNQEPATRHGGLAAWSIDHPVGVSMIALAIVTLGFFALGRLAVDLLPHIIYPEVNVRILDPGVPARIMEDRVTRQLEEQLAITEDATGVQSRSSEGVSSVELSFAYGKDIDLALRDASTRLDRAKRFLPDTIQPPIIFKRDPSQIPIAEYVISSESRELAALRDWVDYDFSKQFLTLPGVAAIEVGGGVIREVQILPDQQRLAAMGLTVSDLVDTLKKANIEAPAGRLLMKQREIIGRTAARFTSIADIRALPIRMDDGTTLRLDELAEVRDTHTDERVRVRLDGVPGVKVSVQKQPSANTVEVVDAVQSRLAWLKKEGLVPADIAVRGVADQAVYVRNALNNASLAAVSGTLLAMAVIYLFLGNLRRTLIIGSAIPLAIMVTFVIMGLGGLTFNIMTLGGLALGVGMLVDNTIVMLENIYRHQRAGESDTEAGRNAATEIHSAIVASTSTNLAAVLPFLFISGLVGLLFRELIFTISAAILASMVVALTLVPALAVRVHSIQLSRIRQGIDALIEGLQQRYARLIGGLLKRPLAQTAVVAALLAAFVWSLQPFISGHQAFLPKMDDGQVRVRLLADPGISLERMNEAASRVETLLRQQAEVDSMYSLVGGFIFGRTQRESSNRTLIWVQLVPRNQRSESSDAWIKRMQKRIAREQLAGITVRMYTRGIRGIRISTGDDDISLRVKGPDLETLTELGDQLVKHLDGLPGLRNISHSSEEQYQELAVQLDRERMAQLGLEADDIARALRWALEGEIVTDYIEGDRSYDVRLRLPRAEVRNPQDLEEVVLYTTATGRPLHVADVGQVALIANPAAILREGQQRIVEVTATLNPDTNLGQAYITINQALADFKLPAGYLVYGGGELEALQEGQTMGRLLLGLALFLVFVVMAVQYESLRNPLVILFSVPFALIGVTLGMTLTGLPLSMPVWLGMIMLAGIVVNNAIVLVEYIEIARRRGQATLRAIEEAARLRLRPILMTTLTTAIGMLPLAIGIGDGAEMLQPLAVTIIAGLSLSLLVTLFLIPIVYRRLHPEV